MTILQISCVAYDHLPPRQVAWIEQQDEARFVEVADGDESLQRALHLEALTEAEALARATDGQRIVYGEKPAATPPGLVAVKAYYRNEYAYEPDWM